MTSEPESKPPATFSPARPMNVTAASRIWIMLGVFLSLGAWVYFGSSQSLTSDTAPIAVLLVIGIGVAFIVLATQMRRGKNGARIALTVLGSVLLLGIWTALFIVPALIMQFRPDSNAWFREVGRD